MLATLPLRTSLRFKFLFLLPTHILLSTGTMIPSRISQFLTKLEAGFSPNRWRAIKIRVWRGHDGYCLGRVKIKRLCCLRPKTEKVRTTAELSMDKELLYSLRGEARKMRIWVKVNKARFIEAVVHVMHSVWSSNELVMLSIGLPLCLNMDRAREIVEV